MISSGEHQLQLESSVIQTLHYFDFFNYPLTAAEIHRYMNQETTLETLQQVLSGLVTSNTVFQKDNFFSLKKDPLVFSKRKNANKLAVNLLPKAEKTGYFLSFFPFVKFVGISGSLSKLYADDTTDFDFFIITSKNRLWIARSLMHLFKKFSFLFNRQKYFCMNYYIAENNLLLEDQNRYTAIELASLKPVVNINLYHQFITANNWLPAYTPNFEPGEKAVYAENKYWVKWLPELLINCFFPGTLNKLLMKLTDLRWRSKWKKYAYTEEDYELAFRTRLYVSKNHPKNFQKLVLKREQEILHKLSVAR